MAINKVEFGDQTLMDLTGDTVTPEDVLNGATFHDRAGVSRSGTASYPVTDVQVNNTSVLDETVAKVTVPTSTSDLNNDSNFVSDASYVHTDNNYTTTEKNKLSGIASGAEVNVQSDWNQTDSTKDDYIKNKPSIPSAQVNSDWNATSGVAKILNKPTLGTAAAKNYTTSVTSGSSDLVTSGAVYTAIDNLPEPMVFKGSLGTGGTITALPVDGTATVGDTYKVITAGTYAGKAAKIGDTFICLTKTSSANTWELIPSGDEPLGTVTSVATGVGLTGGTITTSGTIKAKLRSETALTNDSAAATETANRIYPVVPDKSGYLAVNVPWTDNNTDTKVTQTADDSTNSDFEVIFSNTADNTTRTEAAKKSSKLKFNPSTGNLQATQLNGVTIGSSPKFTDNDTKNTAGSTDTSSKIFLIGATSQAANPQTYSHDTAYVGTDGCLYSGGTKVLTAHQDISGKVNKSGDTMTNTLTIQRTGTNEQNYPAQLNLWTVDSTNSVTSKGEISAYDGGASGANIVITPRGNLFVGSGEAPSNHYNLYKHSTTEVLYMTSDNQVHIQSNGQTIANRLGLMIDNSGNVLPEKADVATNNIGSIGTSSYKWANGYFTNINGVAVGSSPKFTDTTYTAATAAPGKVASASAQGSSTNYARQDHTHGIDLATGDSNGQVKIAGTNVSVKGLGSAAYKNESGTWAINVSGSSASCTGNAATATKLATARSIALGNDFQGSANFDGSGNITISGQNYNAACNSGNKANYPWHRIATVNIGTGTYNDKNAILCIQSTYDGGRFGIVKISTRTNASGGACSCSARWLVRQVFAVDDLYIALWGTTGQDVYADVFLKCGAYARTVVYQMFGNRQFTLVASNEVNNTTASDKLTSVEVYKDIATAATEIHSKAYTSTVASVDTGNVSYANNSGTVNGKTVAVNVPANAKFTDTTYNFSGTTFYSGNKDNAEHNANNAIKNGNYYYTSNGPATSLGASTAGALYVQSYNDTWVGQIAQDYRNGGLYIRGKNNGSWQSWYKVWDSRNLTNLNQLTNGPGYITGITKSMVTTALGYTPPTSDTNTTYTFATGDSNGQIKVTPSGGTAQNVSVKGLGSNAYTSTSYLPTGGGTMTGQLKTSFNSSVAMGSYQPNSTTIANLCNELRYSSGCCGSFSLGTAYTLNNVTIAKGWYNFLWIPHRSGGNSGAADGNNCNYGCMYITGMTVAGSYVLRYSDSAIADLYNLHPDRVIYSGSVSAAVNATTCTINNGAITTSSMIEPFSSNSSGNVIAVTKMAVSAGKVVLTFPALTEATSFKVRITN